MGNTPSAAPNEALNLLITVVINLFVLSMISERLVNFIKLNFQKLYTFSLSRFL